LNTEVPLEEKPQAEVAHEAAENKRPVLSLPKELTEAGIRHWRRGPGEKRPTDEIVSLFSGRQVSHVYIRDPYALAREGSRRAQALFIAKLKEACRSVEAVTVEYAPEAEGDADEGLARREFGDVFGRLNPNEPPKLALKRRSKRSRDDDFHDRFVEIDVRHAGGALRRHELTIGRGLEALFDTTKQCTATYAPPQS
jgi:hypothetical protein